MSPRPKGLPAAVDAIERHGVLLAFPLANRPEPRSLWSVFYPRTQMRWAWDESGDARVVALWHLRGALAVSRRVVYAKWFRGRATFFSLAVFRAMLATTGESGAPDAGLSPDARGLLELLEDSSPRSTRELRRASGLEGRALERSYQRALDELWSRFLIVGTGEVDDGAFPSLALGATRLIFEDLWNAAFDPAAPSRAGDAAKLERALDEAPAFKRLFDARRSAPDAMGGPRARPPRARHRGLPDNG